MHAHFYACILLSELFHVTRSLYIYMQTYTRSIIHYGLATVNRLLKIISLFCRIPSLLQGSFAKETYNFKEPTNRSHPTVSLHIMHTDMQSILPYKVCLHMYTNKHTYIRKYTYKHTYIRQRTDFPGEFVSLPMKTYIRGQISRWIGFFFNNDEYMPFYLVLLHLYAQHILKETYLRKYVPFHA